MFMPSLTRMLCLECLRACLHAWFRFTQAYISAALSNNYRRPVIGYAEDVAATGRRELQAFFTRYYGPPNLTLVVVGDVDPDALYAMAVKYWGDWAPGASCVALPRGPVEDVGAAADPTALDARPKVRRECAMHVS